MVEISLHSKGRKEGIPLVLLPAFPLDARMWRSMTDGLDGWVIAVDPPGFGDSPLPRSGGQAPSLESYAQWLGEALNRVGADRVVMVGASWGGYTALAFAEAYPERLAGIGLIATRAEADDTSMREYREKMAAAINDGGQRMMFPLLETVVSPVTRAEREQVHDQLASWFEQAPTKAIAWAQRAMAGRPGRLAALRGLDIPALVLRGADETVNSLGSAQLMAAELGVAVVEVPAAGHMVAVERPEVVRAAVQRLWDESRVAEAKRA